MPKIIKILSISKEGHLGEGVTKEIGISIALGFAEPV